MAKFIVEKFDGSLDGKVKVSGCKNAALPIMCAAALSDSESVIYDVPDLIDIAVMQELLVRLGAQVKFDPAENAMRIKGMASDEIEAPYDTVSKMRASFLVMGPLLARKKRAKVALPGGCPIGARPVDLHLKGFAAMGAEITQGHGFVEASAPDGLRGATIYLDFPSVGATENIMLGAVTAYGDTVIENAANEPEIVDLAIFLSSMGADISGAGTDKIKIKGVHELGGTVHSIMPDRIETETFMVLAAALGGKLKIENVITEHVKPVAAKLREMGVELADTDSGIIVSAPKDMPIKAVDIKTLPHPGFPTDMQAPFTVLLSRAGGTSIITETIFENRFMHVGELKRMGANIKIDGRSAVIEGGSRLTGTKVAAKDLRAGIAMVIAGLMADGVTEIEDVHHIDRGYECIEKKLTSLGANIYRAE